MYGNMVVKIRDSVDLFLSNDKYIMAYYMNSRQRKSFRVNKEMIYLFENIDGTKTIDEIIEIMKSKYDVDASFTMQVFGVLLKNRIITEVADNQTILSAEIVERYSRQINYFSEFLGSELEGITAQKKLLESHVVIFGCGAIGGDIAIQLAMAGIGHISLFDYDENESSDIARHMYYRNEYNGENKVDSLKKELLRLNSNIKVDTYFGYMNPETDITELIKNASFVVNTLDEPYIGYTASKISRICINLKLPHYIAGGFDAHLASTGELVIPYVTPCVECYATHFKVVLKNWKPKKHPVIKRYMEIGGLASMSLFSSSYACIEIIKCIVGLVKMDEDYKVRGEFLFNDMKITYLNVKKNPDCLICGGTRSNEA